MNIFQELEDMRKRIMQEITTGKQYKKDSYLFR